MWMTLGIIIGSLRYKVIRSFGVITLFNVRISNVSVVRLGLQKFLRSSRQMFFSLTEIISTLACYHISERSNTPPNFTHFHAVAIILGVSAAHLILSWRDQALQYVPVGWNFFCRELTFCTRHFIGVISADMPWMGLVARDLLFSLGDAIAFLLALRLWYFAEQRRLIAGESTLIGLFLIMGYMFFARDYWEYESMMLDPCYS